MRLKDFVEDKEIDVQELPGSYWIGCHKGEGALRVHLRGYPPFIVTIGNTGWSAERGLHPTIVSKIKRQFRKVRQAQTRTNKKISQALKRHYAKLGRTRTNRKRRPARAA